MLELDLKFGILFIDIMNVVSLLYKDDPDERSVMTLSTGQTYQLNAEQAAEVLQAMRGNNAEDRAASQA